jgi:spermidine synthase
LPQTATVFTKEPRLNLIIGDGVTFVAEAKDNYYDLIIVDSTDPIGPGEGLFSNEFYKNCNRILSEQGILINQHECAFYANDAYELKRAHDKIAVNFPLARIYGFNMPTYASGFWYFGFASKQLDPLTDLQAERWHNLELATDYYNLEVHKAAFAMPNYVRRVLSE